MYDAEEMKGRKKIQRMFAAVKKRVALRCSAKTSLDRRSSCAPSATQTRCPSSDRTGMLV